MAQRIKLNKVSLREQKQKMALYQRFLPALEARKQQFLMQLAVVRKDIREQESALASLTADISLWAPLVRDMEDVLRPFVKIRQVRVSMHNVAGLKIPLFQEVVFEDPSYSAFATAYSFEIVLNRLREAIRRRERLRILLEQERILAEGFRKTSQRINLYEQRLIPECREALRKIAVYLQDQQAAAVGVAKVAKRLLEAGL
ncbi:MAG: V-type H+-transporting ATPase subunit D [Syntrophaceae bacterium]|nr:MAG: V-type H+-transporting ATPase subunit D [Syntrophaceae bacterium]